LYRAAGRHTLGIPDGGDAIAVTWHYGLVAEWWAEFNVDGPEIDYFGRFVADGQPALDAGCGAGRLLVPWLRAGYDVDGCDVSADMVARCRDRARREGVAAANLWVQPLHELAPPRRYRTIVACGVFGLGSTREEDTEALRRFHGSLEPGGTLVLDNELPYSNTRRWPSWTKQGRDELPEAWPAPGERALAEDGTERELRVRAISLDPLDQTLVMEIRADKWMGGANVASETHTLSMRMYFHAELMLMLKAAGFAVETVEADHRQTPATADSEFLVYVAERR
jgi:SAM-dependent methyltransferase